MTFIQLIEEPWIGYSIAIISAIGIYSNDRRENPTLGKLLPVMRGLGFGIFMASWCIARLAFVRSHGTSGGQIAPFGLAVAFPSAVIIALKKRAYLKTQKQLKSVPDPVYVEGGAEVWPPAPASPAGKNGDPAQS